MRLLHPRLSKTVCCAREIISNRQLSLHDEQGLIRKLLDGAISHMSYCNNIYITFAYNTGEHNLIPILVPVSIISTAALISMITCTVVIGSCTALAHKRKKRKELEKKEQDIREIENIAMQTSPAYGT